MRIKRKNGLKMIVIALVLLLCLALAVGITGAYYQAKRQATGTLNMDQGIVIDYNGYDKTAADDWATWTRGVTLPLFSTTDAQPGEHIAVNAAGIRANTKSVDFYARVKLSYKFYNNDTEVTLANASDLITTSANFFGTNWVDGGSNDGYYYYATGTTLNKFNKDTQTFVDLFATNAEFVIEGENFTGATSDGEGGGFKIDETTSINKIEVYLTLETLQGDADAAAEGWKIENGQSGGDETKLELNASDYTTSTTTDDETGEEKTIYTPNESFVETNPQYAFTFSLNDIDKTAIITGPVGSPTTLNIPSKLVVNGEEYATTSIGQQAFFQCESLINITINNGITKIEQIAFGGCSNLTTIELPKSLAYIGMAAFQLCAGLQSITIPNGVTSIELAVFFGCSQLNSVNLSENITSIKMLAFYQCESLNYINLPNNLTDIGTQAFAECSKLISIKIPDNVINIDSGVFLNCTKLKSIEFSKNMTRIEDSMFARCSELVSIKIPETITSIENNAFYECSNLATISIPNSLISIGDYVFDGCVNLQSNVKDGIEYLGNDTNNYILAWKCSDKSQLSYMIEEGCKFIHSDCFRASSIKDIKIPETVIMIGDDAFFDCFSLTNIKISNNVIKIGNSVFTNCHNLQPTITENGIAYLGNETNPYLIAWEATDRTQVSFSINNVCKFIHSSCFRDSNAINILIPENVISIGIYAFADCKDLTSINIPKTITSIEEWIFYNCTSLTTITIPISVVIIRDTAFRNCANLLTTIGSGWVDRLNTSDVVDPNTLLKDIDYAIKRV